MRLHEQIINWFVDNKSFKREDLKVSLVNCGICVFDAQKNNKEEVLEVELKGFYEHKILNWYLAYKEKLCGKLILVTEHKEAKNIIKTRVESLLKDDFKKIDILSYKELGIVNTVDVSWENCYIDHLKSPLIVRKFLNNPYGEGRLRGFVLVANHLHRQGRTNEEIESYLINCLNAEVPNVKMVLKTFDYYDELDEWLPYKIIAQKKEGRNPTSLKMGDLPLTKKLIEMDKEENNLT